MTNEVYVVVERGMVTEIYASNPNTDVTVVDTDVQHEDAEAAVIEGLADIKKGVAEKTLTSLATNTPEPVLCDSETCIFNPKGVCLAHIINGKPPILSDDGCDSWVLKPEQS